MESIQNVMVSLRSQIWSWLVQQSLELMEFDQIQSIK